MAKTYPQREWITDYASFTKQLDNEDSKHYFFLMVLKAEKERRRLAGKEKNKRARVKAATASDSPAGVSATLA
jgi:hypothetical protein